VSSRSWASATWAPRPSGRHARSARASLCRLAVTGAPAGDGGLVAAVGVHGGRFDDVAFYVVARGHAYVAHRRRHRPIAAGDLLIVAPQTPHELQDHPPSPVVPMQSLKPDVHRRGSTSRTGAGRETTRLLLGCFRFNPVQRDLLLACLPRLIHLRASGASAAQLHLMQALAAESEANDVGREALCTRLAEALFIHALRAGIDCAQPARG
jgi:hypothetical protein